MNIPRKILILHFFLCALLVGLSFKYNLIDGIPLCPLCFIQVVIFYLIAIVSLVLFFALPDCEGRIAYSLFIFICSLGGISAAIRKIWMNHLANKRLFPCSPDAIHYLFSGNFSKLFLSFTRHYNNCTLQDWSFLGISMPMWSLSILCFFLLTALFMYFHRKDSSQESKIFS